MKLLESLLTLIAPESCSSCGEEGSPLCIECQLLLDYPDRCYRCKKPSISSLTCEKCQKHTPLSAVYVVAPYESVAKDLIGSVKYRASRSTASFLGVLLACKLPYLSVADTVVTHAPTTSSRVRERGFDQSQKIAKSLSASKRLTFANLLYRTTKSRQVGSTRTQRQEHMKQAFGVKNALLVKGMTIVLVDDVLTTGSTLESAARELKRAGAKRVIGAVFARAE